VLFRSDEYGYTVLDFFIFKSTWDFDYHIECSQPNTTVITNLKPQKLISIEKYSSKDKIASK
jgi:hypothetical protein